MTTIDTIRAAWPEIAQGLADEATPTDVCRDTLVISAPSAIAHDLAFFERHILSTIAQAGVAGVTRLRLRCTDAALEQP